MNYFTRIESITFKEKATIPSKETLGQITDAHSFVKGGFDVKHELVLSLEFKNKEGKIVDLKSYMHDLERIVSESGNYKLDLMEESLKSYQEDMLDKNNIIFKSLEVRETWVKNRTVDVLHVRAHR